MARLTAPVLIATQADLDAALSAIRRQPFVAVDTESNSLFAYTERVCLVQVSIPDADYLIDPLARDLDLSVLASLFADARIEKVLHACEYDVICLRRDYGFAFANVFDTMWAARILGWPRVGLADILKERFSVTLDKRWQRHNWGQRPLPPEAQSYARLDTHYLIRLRETQMNELRQRDRLEEAREVFDELAQSEAGGRDESERDGFWRVKGVFDLDPAGRAILRELHQYRDAEARRLNRPPFKVMGDRTLMAIAEQRPARFEQLRGIPGMTQGQIDRHGRHLIQAVAKGRHADPPGWPPRKWIEPAVLDRYERLRDWRKRVAAERGVEADVIIGNAALMALAHKQPRTSDDLAGIDGLGPWRRRTYGASILISLAPSR